MIYLPEHFVRLLQHIVHTNGLLGPVEVSRCVNSGSEYCTAAGQLLQNACATPNVKLVAAAGGSPFACVMIEVLERIIPVHEEFPV